MAPISRLLVISRGEIAVRTIRAAAELGITSIAAYSDADESSLAVRLADESVNIGGSHAKKSYLNHDAIIEAARATKADSVHPGYGFLSESPAFARRVEEEGLIWVGPSAQTISRMGDKATAIETAQRAGLPVVPGSGGLVTDASDATRVAARVGYPIMIKATAGGGGRGIRIAHAEGELTEGFAAAEQEALASFGDGGVYLERLIPRARHIEVQILGDGENAVHFFERDCSLQRRRQKIWEEAPAAVLPAPMRTRMCRAAVELAESVQYRGAGTVEFLYDPDTEEFFFIEMNTRIQVEHPITEEICGVDLIRAMLVVAQGESLPYRQEDISFRGHAIEVRVNSEDPDNGFRPAPGTISALRWPSGPGVRIDSMAYEGYTIPPVLRLPDRQADRVGGDPDLALARLRRALAETELEGPLTTLPFFSRLLDQPDVTANDFHTTWMENWLEEAAS